MPLLESMLLSLLNTILNKQNQLWTSIEKIYVYIYTQTHTHLYVYVSVCVCIFIRKQTKNELDTLFTD